MTKPILLVSDPDRSLAELALALEERGHQVVESAPDADPMELFAQWRPELVFLSLLDEDAESVCEQLRGDPDGAIVPVIFIGTGAESVLSPADALGRGGDYYFEHPLDLPTVLAKVQTYLGPTGGALEVPSPEPSPEPSPVTGRPDPPATRRRPSSMPELPAIDWQSPVTSDSTGFGLANAAEPLLAEILAREAELDGARKAVFENRSVEADPSSGRPERKPRENDTGRRSADFGLGPLPEPRLRAEADDARRRAEADDARRRAEADGARRRAEADDARRRAEAQATARLAEERDRRLAVEQRLRAADSVQAHPAEERDRRPAVEQRLRAADSVQAHPAEERDRRPAVEPRLRAADAGEARLDPYRDRDRGRAAAKRRPAAEVTPRHRVDDAAPRISEDGLDAPRVHRQVRRSPAIEPVSRGDAGQPATRPSEDVDRPEDVARQRYPAADEAFDEADADFVADAPDVGDDALEAVVDGVEPSDGEEPSHGAHAWDAALDLPATQRRPHCELRPGQQPYCPFEPEHGEFSATDDVASVLIDVFYQQVTGRLDFSSEGRQKSVFFEAGMPVDAYSSQMYDRIEEFLFREAKITRHQYQNVRIKRLRTPRQVAAYLVTEGFLKPHELFDVVRGHLREIVLGLLEWEEGTFQYVEEQANEDDRIVLDEDPRRLILEGVRRKYLMPRLMARLGSTTTLLGRVPESDLDLEDLELGVGELELLRLLDGTRSVDDLVLGAGLEPVHACQLLVAMMALGHVEILVRGVSGMLGDGRATDDAIDGARVRDKAEQVRERDYFEILGLPHSATSYEVAQSAERILREFDKDRFSDRVRSELAIELEEIRIVVEDARTALSADDIRGSYARHIVS